MAGAVEEAQDETADLFKAPYSSTWSGEFDQMRESKHGERCIIDRLKPGNLAIPLRPGTGSIDGEPSFVATAVEMLSVLLEIGECQFAYSRTPAVVVSTFATQVDIEPKASPSLGVTTLTDLYPYENVPTVEPPRQK